MISGVLCVLIAEGLLLKSVNIFYWALFFFTINYIYFIVKEEPDLVKRFGEAYKEYRKNVPRWIPRSTPWEKIN
jgi:protein-S-isoprenylcysteine O-methyltransferase Ste14